MLSKERLIEILKNHLDTTIAMEQCKIAFNGDGSIKFDKSSDIKGYIKEIEDGKYDKVFKMLDNSNK